MKHPEEFILKLWILGSIGSIFNTLGCYFIISALCTGYSAGAINSLVSTSLIIVTVVEIFITMQLPHWLQLIGLVFGLVGAFVLTTPDKILNALYFITHCSFKKVDN